MRTPVDDLPPAFAARAPNLAARNATLLFLSALTIMAGATISPALPAIETHFSGSPHSAILTRLVLTVPALAIALCAPVAGFFADRYGRRPVAVAAVLLYAVAGMSGLFVDSLAAMLVGRALLGVAAAGVMTVATALVGDFFAGSARDRFMGVQAAFIGIGGLLFLTGGGLLAELHWRAPFLVYAVALALLPAVLLFIPEPERRSSVQGAGSRGDGGMVLTLPLFAVFAAALLNSVVFYLMPTQLPFHLRMLGTEAPSLAGAALGLMTLASAMVSFLYGRVRGRISIPAIFALGFAVSAGGLALVAAGGTFAAILPGAVLVGAGLGLVMPNLGSAAMGLAPESHRGRVAGLLAASIFLGQFVSPLISQPVAATAGYGTAFGLGAASVLTLALVATAIATIRRRQLA